jgi:hypothetical protein
MLTMKQWVLNNMYNYCSSCTIFFIRLSAADTKIIRLFTEGVWFGVQLQNNSQSIQMIIYKEFVVLYSGKRSVCSVGI